MSKRKVAIIRGGPSSEHEVSLNSAKSVLQYIDRKKYDLVDVFISKENMWSIDEAPATDDRKALDELVVQNVDVAFLAVHGTYCEDGVLQRKLEAAGLPFTGSNSTASEQAFDKEQADTIYQSAGLLIPTSQTVRASSDAVTIPLPVVVKPAWDGSSVGISIVKKDQDLGAAIDLALGSKTRAIVQDYIQGREVSCGVIEKNGELVVLPPTELKPKHAAFFDYKAKYTAGETEEITPPNMEPEVVTEIQNIAKKAHQLLGCSGYSRSDMIIAEGKIYLLETNTLPGMTPTSIFPQEAAVSGISFSELLDLIIAAV